MVCQKSLEEGFGLTVAEAMWKSRAVVASARGGIRDQIVDGISGLLLDDPFDMAGFGVLVEGLLDSDAAGPVRRAIPSRRNKRPPDSPTREAAPDGAPEPATELVRSLRAPEA